MKSTNLMTFIKPVVASLAIALSGTATLGADTLTNVATPMSPQSSHVVTSHEFNLPAEKVWDLIAGFNTLPDYHEAVPESRLAKGGVVRYLTISEEAGGGIVVERLVNFDDEAMTFSYRITDLIESPLPFKNYQAWVRLQSTGPNSCILRWQSRFDAIGPKEEAEEIARVIYQGCYDGIERVLGGR